MRRDSVDNLSLLSATRQWHHAGHAGAPGRTRGFDDKASAQTPCVRPHVHLTDSIDTENLSTRGRLVWVLSSQVRLLDSSVPHNSLPERMGPLGLGVV